MEISEVSVFPSISRTSQKSLSSISLIRSNLASADVFISSTSSKIFLVRTVEFPCSPIKTNRNDAGARNFNWRQPSSAIRKRGDITCAKIRSPSIWFSINRVPPGKRTRGCNSSVYQHSGGLPAFPLHLQVYLHLFSFSYWEQW